MGRILYIPTKKLDKDYGLLYNFWCSAGIAPAGWTIGTDAEWTTMVNTLGGDYSGGHAKLAGYTHWTTPNTGADNSSGFNAKGAGYRDAVSGIASNLMGLAVFRTSTPLSSSFLTTTRDRTLYYDRTDYFRNAHGPKFGYSLRMLMTDPSGWQVGDTVTDYDGNVYQLVKIGDQVWTASNWKCKHLADGTPIPYIDNNASWAAATDMAYCYPNNDPANF